MRIGKDCRQWTRPARLGKTAAYHHPAPRDGVDIWSEQMQAWLCENPTGVEALQWKELPTPQPKAGEVLVEIQAASLNFPDLLIVQNKYQFKPQPPFVPGSEYAGVVQAVGEGVTQLKPGQSVACLSGTGGF